VKKGLACQNGDFFEISWEDYLFIMWTSPKGVEIIHVPEYQENK
jgi:hypothetical protein